MAGDWLKFEKSTLDKPEILAVASALQWDADTAVGKFIRMWSWFDTHTVDGDARGVTPALLDSILRVTGFVAEAEKVGWLEVHPWGIRLPKFEIHCGETAKQRALGAKRNADYRASNAKSDARSVTTASPREEKRREEKKDQKLDATHLRVGENAEHGGIDGFSTIIDAYHAALPKCLHISVLNPKRKRRLGAVRKLAKQVCGQQGWPYDEAAFFGAYWAECAEDPWMRGEVVNPNNPAWKQNLDVLLAEDRFAGVMDRVIERMRGEA